MLKDNRFEPGFKLLLRHVLPDERKRFAPTVIRTHFHLSFKMYNNVCLSTLFYVVIAKIVKDNQNDKSI